MKNNNSDIDISNLLKAIDKELSSSQASLVKNKAINTGSENVAENLRTAFNKFKGTKYSKGYTADEVTRQKARKTRKGRTASIGWNGPHERYRLIHLNEFGYNRFGKRYNPRMMGTVQNTVEQSRKQYFETVGEELSNYYKR